MVERVAFVNSSAVQYLYDNFSRVIGVWHDGASAMAKTCKAAWRISLTMTWISHQMIVLLLVVIKSNASVMCGCWQLKGLVSCLCFEFRFCFSKLHSESAMIYVADLPVILWKDDVDGEYRYYIAIDAYTGAILSICDEPESFALGWTVLADKPVDGLWIGAFSLEPKDTFIVGML